MSSVHYLHALNQVRDFRWRHWCFTREYILKKTSHPTATGGSPIILVSHPPSLQPPVCIIAGSFEICDVKGMEELYSFILKTFRLILKKDDVSCIAQRAQNDVSIPICLRLASRNARWKVPVFCFKLSTQSSVTITDIEFPPLSGFPTSSTPCTPK